MTMKLYGYLLLAAVIGISTCGCRYPSGQPNYIASGALAGGATGAVIGSNMARNSGAGAVAGAAVGAVVGSLIGHGMDEDQAAQLREQSPQTLQRIEDSQPLTVADVKALARAGVSDELIISQIRNSHTVYRLGTADIIDLKNSGVSERVIDFMINTPTEVQSAQVAQTPPPPRVVEQVIIAPGPDYFWVGGDWFWYGNHWVWHRGYWHRPMYRYGHRGR
jgi:surface antigen